MIWITCKILGPLAVVSLTASGCTTYCAGAAAQGPIYPNPPAFVVGVVSKAACAIRQSSTRTTTGTHDTPEPASNEQQVPARN